MSAIHSPNWPGSVDGLAARDALGLDRLGLVEEPVDLLLGIVGEAGVLLSQIETRIWKKPSESASPKSTLVRLDSTSAAMTGSRPGMPRLSASLAIQAAICSLGASSPG